MIQRSDWSSPAVLVLLSPLSSELDDQTSVQLVSKLFQFSNANQIFHVLATGARLIIITNRAGKGVKGFLIVGAF